MCVVVRAERREGRRVRGGEGKSAAACVVTERREGDRLLGVRGYEGGRESLCV